jgi:hypothetical protein
MWGRSSDYSCVGKIDVSFWYPGWGCVKILIWFVWVNGTENICDMMGIGVKLYLILCLTLFNGECLDFYTLLCAKQSRSVCISKFIADPVVEIIENCITCDLVLFSKNSMNSIGFHGSFDGLKETYAIIVISI